MMLKDSERQMINPKIIQIFTEISKYRGSWKCVLLRACKERPRWTSLGELEEMHLRKDQSIKLQVGLTSMRK